VWGKRLTELDEKDERREGCIGAANGVEERRTLALALRVVDRVLTQNIGVFARGAQDDREEVSRHAEVDQEVDVQSDGIRGHERLLAHNHTNETVGAEGQRRLRIRIPRSTYPTDEMRKKSVSTIAPPINALRSLLVSSSASWERYTVISLGRLDKKRSHTSNFEPKNDGQRSRK
jgi:hypothetical protein